MPGVLIELGLGPALQQLINKINDSKLLTIQFNNELGDNRLPSFTEIALYRVVQEVVNNMIKHAQAKTIDIYLKQQGQHIRLDISDDGKGFDIQSLENSKGIGLQNIFSRIKMLHGTVELNSSIGIGTRIHVNLPYVDNE